MSDTTRYGIDVSKFKLMPSEYLEQESKKMRLYNNHKSLMHVDMIYIKDALKGTIYFKSLCSTPPQPDEIENFEFDYWNADLVRLLSQVSNPKFDSMKKILAEFDIAYEDAKLELSESDIEIFECHRNGLTDEQATQLSIRFATDKRNIYKRIKSVLSIVQRKMIENYELDYYYTEIVKGNWKKCSKCGEVLPRNEYYWNKDKTGRDGFRGNCRKCDIKRVKK